ncbi:hypothetical protein JCM14036_02780 [Desulfotomaculum defluvii]
MSFNGTKIELPSDVDETLKEVFKRAKKLNPAINKQQFLKWIITMWLDPYLKDDAETVPKDQVQLKNNLKEAITLSGKTQAQVAREIGISRAYLSEIIRGVYTPSVLTALLILRDINYPIEKFNDVFSLEPIEQE